MTWKANELWCDVCEAPVIDVRVRERTPKAPADSAGGYIRSECIGCGRVFGYRPVPEEKTKTKNCSRERKG